MVDGREVTTLTGHKLKVSISETGQLAVDDAKVVLADTEASNGVVHTIDAVLLVQTDATELAGLGKHGNAVEFASSDRSFSTFLAAVIEANVISSLSQSEGPFTIFAPADSAIRDALVTILTNVGDSMPSAPELVRILQYHVVPYKVRTHRLLAPCAGR